MASAKALIDAECGQANALVQLKDRVLRDASFPLLPSTSRRLPLEQQFANEYLASTSSRTVAPATFSMSSLINQIDRVPQQSPIDRQWTNEYASKSREVVPVGDRWANEYTDTRLATNLEQEWRSATGDSDIAFGQRPAALQWSAEYLSNVDRNLERQTTNVNDTASEWTDEYLAKSRTNVVENEHNSYWSQMDSEWDGIHDESENSWTNEFQERLEQMYKEYPMQEENPYRNAVDPLTEGKRLMAEGQLADAILYFEAAVAQQAANAEAWRLLGVAQSENEQEPAAIAALRRALQLTTDGGADLDALFALGVAYTNESLYNDALGALRHWLDANPRYSTTQGNTAGADKPQSSSFMDREYFLDLENRFLTAARDTSGGSVDPKLQNALGVLYNLSGNFERAVDSLQTALQLNPQDPRLWNRYGATLANSDRSAEAVSAYSKALELYPGYVRARYNLGISCLNLKSHREAVEHFLSALQLQQRGIGPSAKAHMSDNICQSMRVAALALPNKDALLRAIDSRDFNGISAALGAHTTNVPTVGNNTYTPTSTTTATSS